MWFRAVAFTLGVLSAAAQTADPYRIDTLYGRSSIGDGGPALAASLNYPYDIVIDSEGTIFIADFNNALVRRVSPDGSRIDTFAGMRGVGFSGDNGPATQARIGRPRSLALDRANGWLYFADSRRRIRRINFRAAVPIITTYAGTGVAGSAGDNGPATEAQIGEVRGMVVDSRGNLLFSDINSHRIRRIDAATRIVSAYAGSGAAATLDGPLLSAQFNTPEGLALDRNDVLYVAESGGHRIRRVSSQTAQVDTIAGSVYGTTDGVAPLQARFAFPVKVALDEQRSTLYVVENGMNRVRRITLQPGGLAQTIVGTGTRGSTGDNGPGLQATLDSPRGIAVEPSGNVLILEQFGQRVRRWNQVTGIVTAFIGTRHYSPDGVPAASAALFWPYGLAADNAGNLYLGETSNNLIRRISPSGVLSTIAGRPGIYGNSGDNGPAAEATLGYPYSIAVDPQGLWLWFGDADNNVIRQIDLNSGIITRLVAAQGPYAVFYDAPSQTLYYSEARGHRVMAYNLTSRESRVVAGRGVAGYGGDGADAQGCLLNDPRGLHRDRDGNLYIIDQGNHRIRRVNPSGIITTIAGTSSTVIQPTDGPLDGYPIPFPQLAGMDAAGNLYVISEHRLLRISADLRTVTRLAGNPNGDPGDAGDGGPARLSELSSPSGALILTDGRIMFSDTLNNRIRVLTPVLTFRLQIASGDNQRVNTGQASSPLTVQATNDSGKAVSGIQVTFAVASGAATVNPAVVATGSDGLARTVVTMGSTPGAVRVTATSQGVAPLTFNLTAVDSGPPPAPPGSPRIFPGGISSVGLSQPPLRTFSPNQLFSIFGENFLPAGTPGRRVQASEILNNRLPTNLLGVCVEVDGISAPVFDVFAGQINAVMPALGSSVTTARVVVIRDCGRSTQAVSPPESVGVAARAPEFLYFNIGTGSERAVAAVSAESNEYIGPRSVGAGFRPARPGEIVTAYATGLGAVAPSLLPGFVAATAAQVTGRVTLVLGGMPVPAADLLYAGVAPGYYGLYQINFRVPATSPNGNLILVIQSDGAASPAGSWIAVER
jgi:uncharacterized protein (TIGR03437 family)